MKAAKALVRRFYDEVWNRGNYEVADELIAPHGTRITNYTGQNMWRVKAGKLVEIRNNRDDLLVFDQLGLIPPRAELWVRAGMEASPCYRDGVGRAKETPG